jgi:ribosomal-protein-alanine N-acetyltransferase
MCPEVTRNRKPVEVRGCEKNDLREIQEILRAAPEAAVWSEAALAEALERDPSHFLVAEQEEEIAGFIVGREIVEEAEILNLAVKPEYRQRGIGRKLVEAMLEVFARDGVAKAFLEVRESNQGGIAFYRRLGFRETGRREHYYHQPEEAALVLEGKIGAGNAHAVTNRPVL